MLLSTVLAQAHAPLVQTAEIGAALAARHPQPLRLVPCPPMISDLRPPVTMIVPAKPCRARVRIGYAGKIAPRWGVQELLDWTAPLPVDLLLAPGKVSASGGGSVDPGFPQAWAEALAAREAAGDLAVPAVTRTRAEAIALMAEADYVWCWRPPALEEHTLEVSTKLIEMVAEGARCLCYPGPVNRALLGEDYPWFVRDRADLARILAAPPVPVPAGLAETIRARHSLSAVRSSLTEVLAPAPATPASPRSRRVVIAAHDFKFIDGYAAHLHASGHALRRDRWGWGAPLDEAGSRAAADWAEVVLCEWGLANAAWYSRHLPWGPRLIVRCHLQEVNPRARRLAAEIRIDRVDCVVFVAEAVREAAITLFGWPRHKTLVVPNYLLDDEFALHQHAQHGPVRLGLVGIVPRRKRFDRALDLVETLTARGIAAQLHVKGPHPDTLPHMLHPSRAEELAWYHALDARIATSPVLAGAVHFAPWGNDMAAWYAGVDHILSPSDEESFHYALGEGVLSGCHPLLWPWPGATATWPEDWMVRDVADAADRICAWRGLSADVRAQTMAAWRRTACRRYGQAGVFAALDAVLGIAA